MISESLVHLGEKKSGIRELFEYGLRQAAVVGKENVYDYSLGNPSVPAPEEVASIIRELLEGDSLALHGYTPAGGAKEAQQAVADDLTQRSGDTIRPENIFFTCGAAPALVAVLRALAVEDAEFVAIAPYFPEYQVFVSYNGGKFVEVPPDTKNFQVDIAAVERALTPHTQAVLVNSPNNPSGVIYSRETLTALGALLEHKSAEYGHPIYIIADEPYRELVYGGVEVPFLPAIYPNAIYCYSYSKTLSLPGERVGFLALHPAMDDYAAVHAAVLGAGRALGYVCVSSLFQLAVAECLGQTADIAAYAANRELIYGALTDMGYACARPDGAFYLFLKSPEPDARAFCRRAMDYDILLVPGDDFGCPGYARLAYCVARSQLERSLPAFRKLAGSYGLTK